LETLISGVSALSTKLGQKYKILGFGICLQKKMHPPKAS
jgi:hypothetical protein